MCWNSRNEVNAVGIVGTNTNQMNKRLIFHTKIRTK